MQTFGNYVTERNGRDVFSGENADEGSPWGLRPPGAGPGLICAEESAEQAWVRGRRRPCLGAGSREPAGGGSQPPGLGAPGWGTEACSAGQPGGSTKDSGLEGSASEELSSLPAGACATGPLTLRGAGLCGAEGSLDLYHRKCVRPWACALVDPLPPGCFSFISGSGWTPQGSGGL